MTDNQILSILNVLERIANAMEAQAGMQVRTWPKETRLEPTMRVNLTPEVVGEVKAELIAVIDAQKPTEPVIPYNTIREALLKYQDTHGAHAAQSILKSFGCQYIMDLKATPERYADVLAALQ